MCCFIWVSLLVAPDYFMNGLFVAANELVEISSSKKALGEDVLFSVSEPIGRS